jgi:hypothetical protein
MAKGNEKLITELKGDTLPDLNRLYLIEKAQRVFDPDEKELLEVLLESYDSGKVTMSYNPFTGEMMYSSAVMN